MAVSKDRVALQVVLEGFRPGTTKSEQGIAWRKPLVIPSMESCERR